MDLGPLFLNPSRSEIKVFVLLILGSRLGLEPVVLELRNFRQNSLPILLPVPLPILAPVQDLT